MKAVIYARFSSDRQREESIEGQLRECNEYARKNGITIVHEYIDRALSASKDTEKRLDFLKMIRDSGKGQFEAVLVWKLDRFARDRYDSAHYKHILKKNGVRVISATEPISDGPEGIILESMLEGMAEYYSAELSVKIKRGLKENALKGVNNGGRTAFGYCLAGEANSPKHYEPDPLTAPVVREIFQRYADGDEIKDIRDDLNARGIKTNYGGAFRYSTLSVMLGNRLYIGEYHYSDVVVEDGVPALVDRTTFDTVQRRRERNKRAPAAKKATDQYLLTTKLFCGECGAIMAGESGTSRNGTTHRYYKCMTAKRKKGCHLKSVKKEWIEDFVVSQTMKLIFDNEVMNRIADKLMELQGAESYDIKILEKQLAEVNKGIDNMLNAIQAGIITASTKQRLEELEAQRADTENAIAAARIESRLVSRDEIDFFLHRFRDTDITDEQERQRLIDCFVNAVFVYDDRIVLTFNYKDGTKTVSLADVNGSDLEDTSPPSKNRQKWRFFVISTLFLHAFITTLFAFCRLPLSESERAQKIAKTRKRKLPIFHFSASQNPVKTHSRPTPDFLAEITLWTGQDTAGG